MSSLKSRFVLKCWSWYNEHKTRFTDKKTIRTLKLILTALVVVAGSLLTFVFLPMWAEHDPTGILPLLTFVLTPLLVALIWIKKQRVYIGAGIAGYLLIFALFSGVAAEVKQANQIQGPEVINVTPNIYTDEYLPFKWNSKIVKMNNASFKLKRKDDLPIIDGATAAFPVYSAFVHAVYPRSTELGDGVFEYNNTLGGYRKLAERKTDIFFGAYPSKEQLQYAKSYGTTFEFTQVASEAFVFFVHKDNPINSLTAEQIRGIYAGQITNWKEVGGNDEPIAAFQRDEGSGSQSMFLRFMGDTPVMEAETVEVQGMGAIIEKVADYRSHSGSIGFSFRFYVEGIIQNPDIKMIAIDGVAPTVENIQNGTYPVVAPVYAVTWEGNDNPNVQKLLDWILLEEGQYIIEESGYVGIAK